MIAVRSANGVNSADAGGGRTSMKILEIDVERPIDRVSRFLYPSAKGELHTLSMRAS